jgi:phenylpropionate dioxygenase-like ring-hydroxylating dioxygenase large terminal subunit
MADMRIAGVLSYDCPFNWKIIVETFMESYHHIGAHVTALQPHFPAAGTWAEDAHPRFSILHNPAGDDAPADSGFGLTLPPFAGLDETRRREFLTINVFPFHLFTLLPDQMVWFSIDPVAPDRSRLRTHLLVPPATFADGGLKPAVDDALAALDVINREDIVVDTLQQQGAASRLAVPGPVIHLEKANWAFANYLRRRVAG